MGSLSRRCFAVQDAVEESEVLTGDGIIPPDDVSDARGIERFAEPLGIRSEVLSRCSRCLVSQLYIGMVSRTLHVHQVLDELYALEGWGRPTNTKPAEELRGPHLNGLWHKHYMQPGFIEANVALRWGVLRRRRGGALQKLVDEVVRRIPGAKDREKAIQEIGDRAIVDGIEKRAFAKRLTGEWLLFQKHGGKNYYLALADHGVGPPSETRDRELAESVRLVCRLDFPMLADSFGGGATLDTGEK